MAKTAILKIKLISDAQNAVQGMQQGSKAAGLMGKAVAGLGTILAAAKFVRFGKDAIMAAGDLEQSAGAMDAVFKGGAAQMHQWSAGAATAVGLTKNEFNELGTLIGAQLKNGGTAMDELGPKTNQLINLGADLSSMFGGDTKTAVEALSSALKGERDPIEKYGVSLNQAKIDAEAAALGFTKVGGSLSTEAQQAATLSLIMKQTSDAHGNFAKEADTMQGQMQRANATWQNITTTIGQLFLPIVTAVFGYINSNVLPAVSAFVDQLGAGGLGGVLAPLSPLFSQVLAAVMPMVPMVIQLVQQFSPLSILFQVIGGLLPQIVPLFGQVAATLGTILSAVIPLATELAGALVPLFVEFASAVLPMVVTAVTTVVGALRPLVSVLLSVLVPAVKALLPIIVGVVKSILANVTGVIQGITKVITGVVNFVSAIFRGDWNAAWQALQQIVSGAVQAVWNFVQLWIVGRLVKGITGALKAVGSIWKSAWTGIKTFFGNIWSGLIGSLSGWIGKLMGLVGQIPGKIKGVFASAGSWLLNAGRSIVQGLLDGAGQLLPKIGSFFLNMLPGWIKGPFKAALGIASPSKVFTGFGENIAEGVTVGVSAKQRETVRSVMSLGDAVAKAGQAKLSNALAVDLGAPSLSLSARSGAGAPVAPSITINVQAGIGDPVEIGREVDRVLTRYRRTMGAPTHA